MTAAWPDHSPTAIAKQPRANWLDRLIGAAFPGWAVRRIRSRLRWQAAQIALGAFSDAAAKTRETQGWAYATKSADQSIVGEAPVLNARARAAVRNNWAAASIVGGYKRHLVGIGITPKAAGRNPRTNASFEDFNKSLDRLWTHWSRRPRLVDAEGKKSWHGVQRLMAGDWAAVGQSFLIPSFVERTDAVGLLLQVFETEQLAGDRMTPRDAANAMRGGIEINAYGAPVGYWFYTRNHPLESYGETPEFVPAERVRHFIDQERARQSYGVSKLAPSLKKLWHLEMYDEYQLVRARVEACICAILVENRAAGPAGLGLPLGEDDTGTDANGNTEDILEPGMIKRLRAGQGEDLKFLDPTTPGGMYDPFVTQQILQAAAGAMMDFSVVAREYRKATYSAQREARLERHIEIDTGQILFIDQVCQPTWEDFVTAAILQGFVTPPAGYWRDEQIAAACMACDWQAPPKPGIDPAKDAVAAQIEFALGLATLKAKLNERGLDWREVLQQIAEEQGLIESLGLGWLLGPESKAKPAAGGLSADELSNILDNEGDEDGADEIVKRILAVHGTAGGNGHKNRMTAVEAK